ncbi:hypothetical protein CSPX01_07355, partial [Colletotrichum filicis]
ATTYTKGGQVKFAQRNSCSWVGPRRFMFIAASRCGSSSTLRLLHRHRRGPKYTLTGAVGQRPIWTLVSAFVFFAGCRSMLFPTGVLLGRRSASSPPLPSRCVDACAHPFIRPGLQTSILQNTLCVCTAIGGTQSSCATSERLV